MISSDKEKFNTLTKYTPPKWCADLVGNPEFRIPLAMKPTPIHPWNVKGIPADVELYIKRDDMTGCALGGSKVRKLEFSLAEAKVRGYSSVITAGSLHSNHCRSTVIAAKQVGLDCHLILCDRDEDGKKVASGNYLLIQTAGPDIYLLPWTHLTDVILEKKSAVLSQHIIETTGKTPYIIPPGGTTEIGLHGYLCAWEEMIQQGLFTLYDDVVFASGTGGTAKSLAIANYLTGSKMRLHAISVSTYNNGSIYHGINEMMQRVGISGVWSEDLIDMVEDYVGEGYSTYTDEDIAFYKSIVESTGICCDPVYTGKAIKGLVAELNKHPDRFQGKRILFIHTGGVFGLLETNVSMLYQGDSINTIKQWEDVFPDDKVWQ